MGKKDSNEGFTRRDFMKTLGLGGLATGVEVTRAMAGQGQAETKSASVPRRRLGKTGVEVSILSLGGMFDTINNQLLLRQAHNWGVKYWDTAQGYGNGKSEEGIGRFFARNPDVRKDIFLVSKMHPSDAATMSGGLEQSLNRLQTDHVDLLFMHGISDLKEIGGPVREWAADMKKAGKLKFFGFSTHKNMEDCLLGAAKMEWIDTIMFSYNFRLMNTQKMKDGIAACAGAGIGLVAMKTQGGGPVQTDSEAELQMAGRFLERGFTDKQAKLKAIWENPDISSLCSQMPTLTILSANVAASRDLTALTRSDFESLEAYANETRTGYCAGCGKICLEATGGSAPVSDVMRCLMYYKDYGERELARQVYSSLPEEARVNLAKTDYSEAERACPQGLAIAELMKEASRLLA